MCLYFSSSWENGAIRLAPLAPQFAVVVVADGQLNEELVAKEYFKSEFGAEKSAPYLDWIILAKTIANFFVAN